MILRNWLIVDATGNTIPPRVPPFRFRGEVFGHPNHRNGEKIQTQPIVGYDLQEQAHITEAGHLYRLREMSYNYGIVFPKAIKQLQDLSTRYVYYADIFNLDGRSAPVSKSL